MPTLPSTTMLARSRKRQRISQITWWKASKLRSEKEIPALNLNARNSENIVKVWVLHCSTKVPNTGSIKRDTACPMGLSSMPMLSHGACNWLDIKKGLQSSWVWIAYYDEWKSERSLRCGWDWDWVSCNRSHLLKALSASYDNDGLSRCRTCYHRSLNNGNKVLGTVTVYL